MKDPKGPQEGSNRVYRGGSWYYGAGHLQSFIRFSGSPGRRRKDLGFRLVRTEKKKEAKI